MSVQEGAELLDRMHPDWAKRINLDTLKIESCNDCILGQLYGGYSKGKKELGLPFGEALKYGFCADDRPLTAEEWTTLFTTGQKPEWYMNRAWELVEAWEEEIERRLT